MTPLDTKEAAEFLRRSPAAIRNLVLRRLIPHRKVAGRLCFIREELQLWIERSPGVALGDLEVDKKSGLPGRGSAEGQKRNNL